MSRQQSQTSQKVYSLPNLRESAPNEPRRLYSLSHPHLRKLSDFGASTQYRPSPFNIRWINGYNPKADVINLNNHGSTVLFYAAVNCGILYNWTTHEMKILQGHKHMVTNIAADSSGKWLVTADSGPENIITIWDGTMQYPQKTIFSPHHSQKVSKLALSPDAKYLLTLGYHEKAAVYWWIWSFGLDEPHAMKEIEISRDGVVAMSFNPEDSTQFALMTKLDLWVGVSAKIFVNERGLIKETDDYELKIRMIDKSIGLEYGKLTCFTFVVYTSQILVGTSRGAILIYGYTIDFQENPMVDYTDLNNLKFVKALRLEKVRINVIKSIDNVVVTGNKIGEIRFYDEQLKLLYWVHGFQTDSVKGLSFNQSPRSYDILDPKCNKKCPCWEEVVSEENPFTGEKTQRLILKKLPTAATIKSKPFIVRDFVICTKEQGISFVDFVTEKLTTIRDCRPSPATALAVHPEKTLVCVGYGNGTIELHDFAHHKLLERIDIRDQFKIVKEPEPDSVNGACQITRPELIIACLKYSPSGLHLACGLNTGKLIFLDPVTIQLLNNSPCKDTSHVIKEITFSCDSLTLAFSDAGMTVCVYKYDCEAFQWRFVGKHRAHYKDISSVIFTPRLNANGSYKLFSIGKDRTIVEYDVGQSSNECLEVLSLDRVEQVSVPLTGIPWPSQTFEDSETYRDDIPMILIANDENKYKIINYDTTMTLATVLGPRYEHPVCKMLLINSEKGKGDRQYLIFSTKNVIGLQMMPLDGNPWKHVGILGHPSEITEISYQENAEALFTIGAKDSCMIQWAANFGSVQKTTQQGGGDLDPYYCLIEDGRPGWLFQEIRDLFYYIQILCQGTFSPAMRRVKDVIPIDSLPDLMRALGFFPTEYEVENLIVEAKYKVYQRQPSAEIDFEEFVKLYVNHRPAFGDNYAKIRNAFRRFSNYEKERHFIYREDFIDILSTYGECFSRELSWYLLTILNGYGFDERASMEECDFSFLPEEIEFSEFMTEILGVQDMDNLSEQHSFLESIASSQMMGSSVTTISDKTLG